MLEGRVVVRSVLLEDGVQLLEPGAALDLPVVNAEQLSLPSAHGSRVPAETSGPRAMALHTLAEASQAILERAGEARAGGRIGEAKSLLHLVVERGDEMSATASFMLGRLHQADRPELAAHDFAVAIALGLEEPLRRAAFRRRVESLEAAGESVTEARSALQRAYPDEPRLP